MREPGTGGSAGPTSDDNPTPYLESSIVTSYSITTPTTARAATISLRQVEWANRTNQPATTTVPTPRGGAMVASMPAARTVSAVRITNLQSVLVMNHLCQPPPA